MADKSKAKSKAKPTAKKAAKPATPAAGKAAKKTAKSPSGGKPAKKARPAPLAVTDETYYLSLTLVPAGIHATAPAGGEFVELPSFDAARERLVEHLIETIEALEHRLHSVRRIGTFADYRDLG